jgi:hypothetical protein
MKRIGLLSTAILMSAVGLGSAQAAMCGRSCDYGGRYIPGPPEVCYERGLNYCGSSRERPPAERPGLRLEFGRSGPTLHTGPDCQALRRACIYKEERGEEGEGNCRRYRRLCGG